MNATSEIIEQERQHVPHPLLELYFIILQKINNVRKSLIIQYIIIFLKVIDLHTLN